jgi:hypothetical protein
MGPVFLLVGEKRRDPNEAAPSMRPITAKWDNIFTSGHTSDEAWKSREQFLLIAIE